MPRGGVLPLMIFWIEFGFEAGSGVPNLMTCSCQSGVRVAGIEEDLYSQRLWEIHLQSGLELVMITGRNPGSLEQNSEGFAKQSLWSCVTARPRTEQSTALSSPAKPSAFVFSVFLIPVVRSKVRKISQNSLSLICAHQSPLYRPQAVLPH